MIRRRAVCLLLAVIFSACNVSPPIGTDVPTAPKVTPEQDYEDGKTAIPLNTTPFVDVLRIERVELVEPIPFSENGVMSSETDLVLFFVRLNGLTRFLPRGSLADEIVFEDVPVQFLWSAGARTYLAVIAPTPERPLIQTELWIPASGPRVAELSPEELIRVRDQATALGPHNFVPLGPAVREGRLEAEVKSFTSQAELVDYATDVADTLEESGL